MSTAHHYPYLRDSILDCLGPQGECSPPLPLPQVLYTRLCPDLKVSTLHLLQGLYTRLCPGPQGEYRPPLPLPQVLYTRLCPGPQVEYSPPLPLPQGLYTRLCPGPQGEYITPTSGTVPDLKGSTVHHYPYLSSPATTPTSGTL